MKDRELMKMHPKEMNEDIEANKKKNAKREKQKSRFLLHNKACGKRYTWKLKNTP